MSLSAIIHHQITNINVWDSSLLNIILCAGNSLYTCISNSINKTLLLLTDVLEMVSVSDRMYFLKYSDPFAGDLFMTTNNLPYYSLKNALNNLFLDSQLNAARPHIQGGPDIKVSRRLRGICRLTFNSLVRPNDVGR